MSIGTVWGVGTWESDTWGDGTWGDAAVSYNTRAYRLRVRNASTVTDPDGTADVLVVTSLRTGDTPYIAEPPDGDGQEIDVLSGGVRTGSYSVRVLDAVESVTIDGTVRYVTSRLEDASFRQQLLSRRAYLEVSTDNGATWTVLHAGYVNTITLASAISYVFSIGDTRRVETSRRVFTWSPTPGPLGISERDVFPNRGCLVGGPIIGGFGPVADVGGDQSLVMYTPVTDPATNRAFVYVEAEYVFLPPAFERRRAYGTAAVYEYYQKVLQPYSQAFGVPLGIPGLAAELEQKILESYCLFSGVTVLLTDGTTEWRGDLLTFSSGLFVGPGFGILLDAASSVSPPASADRLRMRVIKDEVGADAPIYIDLHPVDLVTSLFDTVGIVWDATTAAAVRTALGDDLRYAIRVTEPVMMLDFLTTSVFGPFGFSTRNSESGAQEFFLTRLLSDAVPSVTITTDSLTTADPPIFDLDEGTIVSAFKITYRNFARTTRPLNASPPPPPDGIEVAEVPVILQNGDLSVFSTREVDYDFLGFVHLAGSWASAMPQIIDAIATLGFDRFGRGAPTMEVAILASNPAYAAKLGDEVYLDVAHYPNRGYRIGESTVGARIAQVVRRTVTPSGAMLKLIDSGLALQPASPTAAITIAADPNAPRTVARVTITNAAAINATGVLFVAVEWTLSASTPTGGGQVIARFEPGDVPTAAFSLPAVLPGARVWARARTEQTGRRPSAWTSWVDVTLGAFAPPTGAVLGDITAESLTLTWIPSNFSFFTEVFVAEGTTAPTDWGPYRMSRLSPGSTRAVLRGLDAGTDYIAAVCHVDPVTGERTTFATDTETTTNNAVTASTPLAVTVIPSEEDASQPVGIGVALYAFDETLGFELQRAPDNAGVPGTWTTLTVLPGTAQVYRDLLPSDGLVRWYRARHILPGLDPSPWIGAQSGRPGACPVDLARPALRPVIAAYVVELTPLVDYDVYYSGVGTIEYRVNGGAWTTPGASPINVPSDTYDTVLDFRATLNGQEVSTTVTVPGSVTATIDTLEVTRIDGTTAEAVWTVTGMPGGVYYTLEYDIILDGSGSGLVNPAVSPESGMTVTLGTAPHGIFTVRAYTALNVFITSRTYTGPLFL